MCRSSNEKRSQAASATLLASLVGFGVEVSFVAPRGDELGKLESSMELRWSQMENKRRRMVALKASLGMLEVWP